MGTDSPCFLSHMLSMAAVAAPNLRRLTVYNISADQPVFSSLSLLSKVEKLTLTFWDFSEMASEVVGITGLSGLRSLQVHP
jgi:hypothetical protein